MDNAAFFLILPNTTVCEFNNFNIGSVNVIQKKFVKQHEIGQQIKSLLLLMLLQ